MLSIQIKWFVRYSSTAAGLQQYRGNVFTIITLRVVSVDNTLAVTKITSIYTKILSCATGAPTCWKAVLIFPCCSSLAMCICACWGSDAIGTGVAAPERSAISSCSVNVVCWLCKAVVTSRWTICLNSATSVAWRLQHSYHVSIVQCAPKNMTVYIWLKLHKIWTNFNSFCNTPTRN